MLSELMTVASRRLGKNCYMWVMHYQTLASGPGWGVYDNVCTAGPHDRPFEEQHEAVCMAAVVQGAFRYRSTQGVALLTPGAVLLGNHGYCYECGHEHGTGDRCLSFHFSPDCWEDTVATLPGARAAKFAVPRLPPSASLIPLIADVEAACAGRDRHELEELAFRFAGAVAATLADAGRVARAPSQHDERRIARAIRRIETAEQELSPARLSLATLASEAAMSPYHFLRTFRQVVGMTPHQFVLRTRMHRAAVRLRRSVAPVSTIAFDAGFNDLSTFNRRFRRLMGVSPSVYRARG
jgi:AraC family transcriptional regulator